MTGIKLDINGEKVSAEISGHSGYGECGNDIVCAAISALAFTLRSVFCDNTTNGNAYLYDERVDDGYMGFDMTVLKNRELVIAQLKAVFKGFELLEENYPENIKTVIINADRTGKQM